MFLLSLHAGRRDPAALCFYISYKEKDIIPLNEHINMSSD